MAEFSCEIAEATVDTSAMHANRQPLEVSFGDNGGFYVFYCARCRDVPVASWFDCA